MDEFLKAVKVGGADDHPTPTLDLGVLKHFERLLERQLVIV
jgi:hypothetical protein